VVRRALLAFAVVLVVWLVACYLVVLHPTINRLTRADAVVVLGPPVGNGRLSTALRLVDQGYSSNLVISLNSEQQHPASDACASPPSGVTVTCFSPHPGTTQGEAREIRTLATQRRWHTLIVVTSTYHVSRARLILSRCFSGRLEMVNSGESISVGKWAYQFVYQSIAYVKAFVSRSC
jgi:uncharacterized SAM-binding protein YcdF (DUF218 family)